MNINESQLSELKQLWANLFPETILSQRQWALWSALNSPAAMKEAFVALATKLSKLESQNQTMSASDQVAYASSVMNRVTRQGA